MRKLFYLVSVVVAARAGFKFGSAAVAIVANDYVRAIYESGFFGITYEDVVDAMRDPVVKKKAREYVHKDFTDISIWKQYLARMEKNK